MVDFWVYDVTFLVLFTIWVIWFIRTRKKGITCEGKLFGIPMIFMFRTQAGVKAINYVGDNFKGLLKSLKWVIITLGYFLMAFIIWMFWRILQIYIVRPEIVEFVKAPPVAPLIPYFPKLFGMESFFPEFYFTYFLIALAIVAVVHEFSHGIFMRLFKIKIKSTGLVFIGPLLGAFVEEERKNFEKRPKTEQMAVLGAGVFANVVTALVFYGIWILMFSTLFVPSGYQFNMYASGNAPASMIEGFGADLGEFTIPLGEVEVKRNMSEVRINGTGFLVDTTIKNKLIENDSLLNTSLSIPIFMDAPAIRSQMKGLIVEANGVKIKGQDSLREYLEDKSPGDEVTFVLEQDDGELVEKKIVLAANPINSSIPYIGVMYFSGPQTKGFFAKVNQFVRNPSSTVGDPATHYEPIIFKDFVEFVYLLLWWIILINFLVAAFNMVPASIFDGGRFFYLTILGITRNEKVAKKAFKLSGYALLLWLVAIIFLWAIRVI